MKETIAVSKRNIFLFIFFAILAFACGNLYNTWRNHNIIEQYEQNIQSLHDTTLYYYNETNELVAKKIALRVEIDDLKYLNDKFYKKIKDLEAKNKVLSATNFDGKIENPVRDTTFIIKTDTIYKDFNHIFDFSDDYRTLMGKVNLQKDSLNISIDKDITYFDYTVALDEKNNILISSNNPYVSYNSVTGFSIPKKKKTKFAIGPAVGIGYGFINSQPDIFVGINAMWKVFEF